MKRAFFLLVPLVIGLVSCNKSIPNQEAVNELKTLLDKQDLSPFYSKAFGTMFTQEYDALDVYIDEEERATNYFNYIGLGFLDLCYDLTNEEYDSIVDENGNVNVFDAIKEGQGGYRITQSAKTSSFFRESGTSSSTQNLDISQQMTLKTTEDDACVYNILDVTDTDTFDYASRQYFNGAIDKELLFGSVSTRTFRDIFSSVHLFDAPSSVEYLDSLYYSKCRELKNMNDQEISEFIIKNKISLDEVENNIELSFVFGGEEISEEYQDIVVPGDIKGKLLYDKNTGEFVEFNYKIKCLNETYDEESGSVKTANMIFECSGKSARGGMSDMWTPDNPTIYDNVIDFLEDVREQVVPPSIYQ